jgi:hypothetical protein
MRERERYTNDVGSSASENSAHVCTITRRHSNLQIKFNINEVNSYGCGTHCRRDMTFQ